MFHQQKIRAATIYCVTTPPINAIEIRREYFEKYLASSGLKLHVDLIEKDRSRKRDMDKIANSKLKPLKFKRGDVIFREGDDVQGYIIHMRKGYVSVA